jgi:dolichyl-phosphate-mannose-protein mannosyltransferase
VKPSGITAGLLARCAAIAMLALVVIAVARPANGAGNLLLNGDLSKGSENQPDHWRTEAWVNSPDAFRYDWSHPVGGGPGTLEVDNLKPDDGRWMQSLTLAPGWYYCSVQLRTQDVGTAATGATISVMEDGIMSSDIRGTTAWQRVGFYLRVGGRGADVDIALRVGGFGSLNVGRAYFRQPSVTEIETPPPGAQPQFDLQAIRRSGTSKPVGSPITLVATFILLAAIAIWGWRRFTYEPPAPARGKPAPPKGKPGKRQ